jgi:REP element-mobilizing transposase RayT
MEYRTGPLAYFLTWTCYGTWLHGDEHGSVDRQHNKPGQPFVRPSGARQMADVSRMHAPAYLLDPPRREIVLASIRQSCTFRDWDLLAAHVRSNHIHVVVTAAIPPERILSDLKAYASRRLTSEGFDDPSRKRWTRHGSTRYLWTDEAVVDAIEYVVEG